MESGLRRTIRTPVLALLASLIGLLLSDSAVATDIWTEDFTGQEGKGMYGSSTLPGIVTNMSGVTKWSVSGGSDIDGDTTLNWWMVTNGVFEGQDTGTTLCYWQSEDIDVTSNQNVQIRMDFGKLNGGCNSASEQFWVRYGLDAGTFSTSLEIDQNNQDDFDGTTWTSPAIDASSATSMVVQTRVRINGTDDGWSFDNVALQTAAGNQPPVLSHIGVKAVASGDTLSFDVTAIDPVDGDMISLSASNLPSGAVFAPITNAAAVTNTFTWTSANPVGVYTTTFYAADSDGVDSETIEITVAGFAGGDGEVWINELHYDNAGNDTNEGFEIAGPAGLGLSDYVVYHYNGSGGATYSPHTTDLDGVIDDEANKHGAVWFGVDKDDLQNGPDGLALVRIDGEETNLLQFLSYEGEFVAVGGPADGVQSIQVGVSEPNTTTIGHSLQLKGKGSTYSDFTWFGPTNHTRGTLNTGQIIILDPTVLVVR